MFIIYRAYTMKTHLIVQNVTILVVRSFSENNVMKLNHLDYFLMN